jgi:hypothetical protein
MDKVFPGRYTVQMEGEFVVFLIGMRINNFFALRSWMQVITAMPPMIAELKRNPELGMLHTQFILYWRGIGVLQYWKSFDHLHAYAHARDAKHLPAWAEFNKRIGNNGSVGIWHETYTVGTGQYESIYANMPQFGLGAAGEHLTATGRLQSARSRIGKNATE